MRVGSPVAKGENPMAKGGFHRKKGKLLFCYYNANGSERAKMLGPDTMTDDEGWVKVGELGFGKIDGQARPGKCHLWRFT
jgi:hypothetical protein